MPGVERGLRAPPPESSAVRICLAYLLAALAAALPVAGTAEGTVVIARATHDPVIVWDATQEIYAMIGQGTPDRELNARVEHDALAVARSKATALRSASGTLTVRIVYQKTLRPDGTAYKVATLDNASLYATLRLPVAKLSRAPAPGAFRVVGSLPGR